MCNAFVLVNYSIKKSNDSKRYLVFLFLLASEYFNHKSVSMLCYDHNFFKLQTLLSLEYILRKFHVNCHTATVYFPLPRHIAFIIEPPCTFLVHFLGASVVIVLKIWLKGYKRFERRVVSPSALDDFPGHRIFVVCQTGIAVHIPAESVAAQPVVKR